MTSYRPQDPALREKYLTYSFTPLRIWEEDAMQSVLLEKRTSNHKFGGREWMDEFGRETFDWPPLHTVRHKPLQDSDRYFLGANGHMPLLVFICDPAGGQRSDFRIRERKLKRPPRRGGKGKAKRQTGTAPPTGYRSSSVGESREKGRSAVAEANHKSPCCHCNGTGESVVTDTYGSTWTVRQSWRKGDEVYSAVVPMRLVPSPPPFPPPSHLKPGRKAAEKVTKSFITTHGKTIRRGKTIGGGKTMCGQLFNRKGMINHPRASTMGKTNIPKRSDKDRQRRDPNDPENPCEGGGTIPLGGSGGMSTHNR